MSIKIHHGAPGSYKTSGAVMDDLIPALREGRPIVTNVRGLTRQSVLDAMDDLDEKTIIINVDTKHKKGRDKLGCWFHWVPKGAFMLIDEAQHIFPKKWKDSDLKALDYPGGPDKATEDDRPPDFLTAFDMHRHYNWDMVLTTPNIKKIRADIREASERAYKHKNKALLGNIPGLRGRYLEGAHPADENGSPSQIPTIVSKKIKPLVWRLYESTATGEFSDTKAGQSIFKNTRLVMALAICAFCTVYGLYRYFSTGGIISSVKANTLQVEEKRDIPASIKSSKAYAHQVGSLGVDNVVNSKIISVPVDVEPFKGQSIDIRGYIKNKSKSWYQFAVQKGDTWSYLTSAELKKMGYKVNSKGDCLVELVYSEQKRKVTCGSRSHEYFTSSEIASIGRSGQRGGTERKPDSPKRQSTSNKHQRWVPL